MRILATVAGIFISAIVMFAQPAFEAVSVKPSPLGQMGGSFVTEPGGRMIAHNLRLSSLIGLAYSKNAGSLRPDELAGEPAWTHTTRYDIEARATSVSSPDGMLNTGEISALLRTLLQDRFKVAAHIESRMLPAYALVLVRADGALGPNLRHSSLTCTTVNNSVTDVPQVGSPPGCGTRVVDGALNAGGMRIQNLAMMLENALGRQAVLDETGLAGTFDVDLRWAPAVPADDPNRPVSTGPSIFTAVQEQLGLKLEPRRAPRDVVVIDHVEALIPD